MAKAGDVVDLGKDQRVVFVRTAADTGGELLELESYYRPGSRKPPEHYHPRQEERFTGVRGKVNARVGRAEHLLGAGDELVIPASVEHAFWNAGTEEAVIRW